MSESGKLNWIAPSTFVRWVAKSQCKPSCEWVVVLGADGRFYVYHSSDELLEHVDDPRISYATLPEALQWCKAEEVKIAAEQRKSEPVLPDEVWMVWLLKDCRWYGSEAVGLGYSYEAESSAKTVCSWLTQKGDDATPVRVYPRPMSNDRLLAMASDIHLELLPVLESIVSRRNNMPSGILIEDTIFNVLIRHLGEPSTKE